jgi:hypothetical protein
VLAGPNRYGHSDRVERHMLPAVSTGPLDPAWRPDGTELPSKSLLRLSGREINIDLLDTLPDPADGRLLLSADF